MHGDLYDGVLFNRRYQTREPNEHQDGNVRLSNTILVISKVSSFTLIYVLVTMKGLLAVKVRRVLQVLAQKI